MHTPTLFPLSRECMRPKLYMSTVESPSFAFFFSLHAPKLLALPYDVKMEALSCRSELTTLVGRLPGDPSVICRQHVARD